MILHFQTFQKTALDIFTRNIYLLKSIVFDDAEFQHFYCLNFSLIGMTTHYSIGGFLFLPPLHILFDKLIPHFTECSFMFVPNPLKGMMLDNNIIIIIQHYNYNIIYRPGHSLTVGLREELRKQSNGLETL